MLEIKVMKKLFRLGIELVNAEAKRRTEQVPSQYNELHGTRVETTKHLLKKLPQTKNLELLKIYSEYFNLMILK
jgi:hypothetical protein